MGQLTFQATLGGAVNLAGPNTAATTTFTLPAADGSSGQALTTNASGTLAFANIPLASAVSGTLPIANGGTNSTATPTAGGVGYGTGTANAYTSAGTAGYFLQSNGASAPSWVTAPGGGSWIYLSTVTASNSATVDIETTINSTYQNYAIVASTIIPVNDFVHLRARQKQGGSYLTADYQWHLSFPKNDSTSYAGDCSTASGTTFYQLAYGLSEPAGGPTGGVSFVMYLPNPSNTTVRKAIFCTGVSEDAYAGVRHVTLSGTNISATTALTGIRFYMSSGNISTGTFRLYGIKNS
jgi:hypothetical protein